MAVVDPLRFRVHGGQRWLAVAVALAAAAGVGTFVAAVLLLGALPVTTGLAAQPAGDVVVRSPAGTELPVGLRARLAGLPGVATVVDAVDRRVDLMGIVPGGETSAPTVLPGTVQLVVAPAAELDRLLAEQGCRLPTGGLAGGVWAGPALGDAAAGGRLELSSEGRRWWLGVDAALDCPPSPGLARGAVVAADPSALATQAEGATPRPDVLVLRRSPGAAPDAVAQAVRDVAGPGVVVDRGPVRTVASAAPRGAVAWLAGIAVAGAVLLLGVSTSVALASRRERLATLRVLGATGAQLRRAVLVELAVPHLVGAAVGVVAGDRLARWSAARVALPAGVAPWVRWSGWSAVAATSVVVATAVPLAWSARRSVRPFDGAPRAGRSGRSRRAAHRVGRRWIDHGWTALLSMAGRTGRLAAVHGVVHGRRLAVGGGAAVAVVLGVGLSTVSAQVEAAQQQVWRRAADVDAWIQSGPPGGAPQGRVAAVGQVAAVRVDAGVEVLTGATTELRLGAVTVDLVAPAAGSAHPLWVGASAAARRAMAAGTGIVVTPRAAEVAGLRVGSRVRLAVPGGERSLEVVQLVDGGHAGVAAVATGEAAYRRWSGDSGVSWIEVRSSGREPVRAERTRVVVDRLATVLDRPAAAHPGRYQPLGVTDELRLVAAVADALGWVLALGAVGLAALVAVVGVLGSGATLGTLVDLGLEPSVARRLPAVEPMLLAACGVLVGVPVGLLVRGRLASGVLGELAGGGTAGSALVRAVVVGSVVWAGVAVSVRVAGVAALRAGSRIEAVDLRSGAGEGRATPEEPREAERLGSVSSATR